MGIGDYLLSGLLAAWLAAALWHMWKRRRTEEPGRSCSSCSCSCWCTGKRGGGCMEHPSAAASRGGGCADHPSEKRLFQKGEGT